MLAIAALPLLLAAQAAPETAPATPPPLPKCDTPGHAAFDFWVGEWAVFPQDAEGNEASEKIADSRIERLHAGCAIRESWMPLKGGGGSSLSNLDPETGLWHQTWIGLSPGRVEFTGGAADGKMLLTGWWPGVGGPGKDGWVRMTYSQTKGGAVRQRGEMSTDHGLSWKPAFDLIYRPRPAD